MKIKTKTKEDLIKEIRETLPIRAKLKTFKEVNKFLKDNPNEKFIIIINNDFLTF